MAVPRYAVLGAGTWGATLADVLARNEIEVSCWDIDSDLIQSLSAYRRHPKLLKATLHPKIMFTASLESALEGIDSIAVVTPSSVVRRVLESLKSNASAIETWVIASKGIEQNTLMLMHEVFEEVLGTPSGIVALSGPSHAEEVSIERITMLVACSASPESAAKVQQAFFRPCLRVYTHDDVIGVELGGALKNVIAIASGICDGFELGNNARAALMTRGLAEIVRLGLSVGAKLETFMGLSGLGDLIVTAGGPFSRNHRFGMLLSEGRCVEDALNQVGMVVEGYPTSSSAWKLALKHQIEMPITQAVYQVLYEGLSPRMAVERLLAREPRPEHY